MVESRFLVLVISVIIPFSQIVFIEAMSQDSSKFLNVDDLGKCINDLYNENDDEEKVVEDNEENKKTEKIRLFSTTENKSVINSSIVPAINNFVTLIKNGSFNSKSNGKNEDNESAKLMPDLLGNEKGPLLKKLSERKFTSPRERVNKIIQQNEDPDRGEALVIKRGASWHGGIRKESFSRLKEVRGSDDNLDKE